MQNHGGYSESYYNFSNSVVALGKNNDSLNQYLSLISVTDEAFRKLIDYFKGVDEDTIVVFFGDHQPNDAVTSSIVQTQENDYNRYQVPYIIWANFDIDSASNADTSVNYLAANVLKAAGVQTSDYQNYLLSLEEKWPIVSAIRTEKGKNASDDDLKEYQKLQYYMLFDREEK